jgi:hypothetical protein
MLVFRHKDSKAQSGTKESKKKKVTLSASFCFCVFVAIKHIPKENFNTAYIANQYQIFVKIACHRQWKTILQPMQILIGLNMNRNLNEGYET